jgi:hypothetical protein
VRRRPFTALAALGTAAHHAFEVNAGVGLVFEPFLGRRGALALWLGLLPGQVLFAFARDPRFDRPLALGNGAALAGGLVHFAEWPWELRHGIPALTEAEGMTAERVPAYNLVLQSWVLAAALALATETPRRALPWAAAGLASFEPLRRSARHHFRWARERAREEPQKWSPALRDDRA